MAALGWWIVHTTVRPDLATFCSTRMTMAAARASSPDVGSSANTIEGLATSSTPSVTRLFCSIDSRAHSWSCALVSCRPAEGEGQATSRSLSSSSSSVSSTKFRFCSRVVDEGSRSSAENSSASRIVDVGTCTPNCSTYAAYLPPARARQPPLPRPSKRIASTHLTNWAWTFGSPSMSTSPLLSPTVFLPAMTSINVVLPAPEEPIKAVMRPGCVQNDTPLRKSTRSPLIGMVYLHPRAPVSLPAASRRHPPQVLNHELLVLDHDAVLAHHDRPRDARGFHVARERVRLARRVLALRRTPLVEPHPPRRPHRGKHLPRPGVSVKACANSGAHMAGHGRATYDEDGLAPDQHKSPRHKRVVRGHCGGGR
jgi:hypothetical protein